MNKDYRDERLSPTCQVSQTIDDGFDAGILLIHIDKVRIDVNSIV